ncbi:hypothetical protein TGDOM2_277230 [Toxoplasma gondii GAB2-2007-GAL-DOM2]|uniref:Uncharacterized protein n=3 Tax=Toxoplasma gondii TaxID=5811 RepID=S7UZI6_TOXGG|nr:hypothetical protein TGGT1_277230 [Toxoplasma gondii GT1]KFG34219.1 hypothetical protein TGDOM2_277230 [Toxoplasma gondii GAB2-2007-GAL-DOM2]KYF40562.1 hypothetical protein TGARI_277230 [Toxoplasma gondii ARI]
MLSIQRSSAGQAVLPFVFYSKNVFGALHLRPLHYFTSRTDDFSWPTEKMAKISRVGGGRRALTRPLAATLGFFLLSPASLTQVLFGSEAPNGVVSVRASDVNTEGDATVANPEERGELGQDLPSADDVNEAGESAQDGVEAADLEEVAELFGGEGGLAGLSDFFRDAVGSNEFNDTLEALAEGVGLPKEHPFTSETESVEAGVVPEPESVEAEVVPGHEGLSEADIVPPEVFSEPEAIPEADIVPPEVFSEPEAIPEADIVPPEVFSEPEAIPEADNVQHEVVQSPETMGVETSLFGSEAAGELQEPELAGETRVTTALPFLDDNNSLTMDMENAVGMEGDATTMGGLASFATEEAHAKPQEDAAYGNKARIASQTQQPAKASLMKRIGATIASLLAMGGLAYAGHKYFRGQSAASGSQQPAAGDKKD